MVTLTVNFGRTESLTIDSTPLRDGTAGIRFRIEDKEFGPREIRMDYEEAAALHGQLGWILASKRAELERRSAGPAK